MKMKDIVTKEKLLSHAVEMKAKGGKPGIDGMTAEAAVLWIEVNGERLMRELYTGAYSPSPALGFATAKQHGGYRELAILTVIDKIIQQCLLEAFDPVCERIFSPFSFAYRRGRGMGEALKQFSQFASLYPFASVIDLKSCYDSIDHELLLDQVRKQIGIDQKLFELLKRYLCMPLYIDNRLIQRDCGILQGAVLSPLLCNLYLHRLDRELEKKKVAFIRYADDIVLFGGSFDCINDETKCVIRFLSEQLKLEVNSKKCRIEPPVNLRFLGHDFHRDRKGIIALRPSDQAEKAYFSWYHSKPRNPHKTVNVLSDGILRQKEYTLLFEGGDGNMNIPVLNVDMINIYSNVVFDSGFLQKALDSRIYVNIFDRFGKLKGRYIPHCVLKSPIVTYRQIVAYFDKGQRLAIAKEFVLATVHNIRLNLNYQKKHSSNALFDKSLQNIRDVTDRIKGCEAYEELLLLEASAHKEYYNCFDSIIKSEGLVFDRRSRRPPQSEINAMLSFGNTVLYNWIAFKINKSPLDIRVGFLHATNGFRLESLQLDIADVFKPLLVDRVVFSLCNLRSIRPEHFVREDNNAVYLSAEGKKIFLRGLYDKLDEGLTLKGKYYTYNMILDEEVQKLVRRFRNDELYRAFRQVQ